MNPDSVYRDSGKADRLLIDEFEIEYRIKLPNSYKELIQEHNALWPEKCHFRFHNRYHNKLWTYQLNQDGTDSRDVTFYGFGEHLFDYERIDLTQDFDVFGHENVIAFGSSANGDYICFDYRHDPSTNEPHVVVMFHDAYDEYKKMLICHVANSFEEFMDSLYKSDE